MSSKVHDGGAERFLRGMGMRVKNKGRTSGEKHGKRCMLNESKDERLEV